MTSTAAAKLQYLDPTRLTSNRNIRADLDLDDAFRASIRDLGVLSPIVAEPHDDGTLLIRSGHRRAAAAAAEGLTRVPVLVLPADASDQVRLAAQIAENTARRDLTTADLVNGHEQLATFGMPITAAAAATGMTVEEVDAARRVTAAPQARALAEERQLSLAQAAGLAEFDDDPRLDQLLGVLDHSPEHFDHELEAARDERRRDHAVTATARDYIERGYLILDGYPDRSVAYPLMLLAGGDDTVTPDNHGQCPGRAVTVRAGWRDDEDGNPAISVQEYCTEPSRHNDTITGGGGPSRTPVPTDDERAEAARDQRRTVIANNKAWRSAETVRRRHVKDWLATATIKGPAARWIVAELAHQGLMSPRLAADLARDWAGSDYGKATQAPSWRQPPTSPPTRISAARAHTLTAGLVLADMELATSVESWRSAHAGDRTSRYLTFLADHTGYTLSDVEKLATPPAPVAAKPAASRQPAATR